MIGWCQELKISGASKNEQKFLDCLTADGLSQWLEGATFVT